MSAPPPPPPPPPPLDDAPPPMIPVHVGGGGGGDSDSDGEGPPPPASPSAGSLGGGAFDDGTDDQIAAALAERERRAEPQFDPTAGGLRHFKAGKLPWAQPSWLFLNGCVHSLTALLELCVIAFAWYCGTFSSQAYFDASLQVDFNPDDLIVTDKAEWQRAAAQDLCQFVACQVDFVTIQSTTVRNITRSRSGIVLLQGIEQVEIRVTNPTVWGLPALATQRRNVETVMKNPTAEIYIPPYGRFTTGGAGTLQIIEGPPDPLSPSTQWAVAALFFIALTATANSAFLCFFDPETATDPYPEGWEVEGLDDEEFGSKLLAVEVTADGELAKPKAPPSAAEVKRIALHEARKREKEVAHELDVKTRGKRRRRRCMLSMCCCCAIPVMFVKLSLRDTRESFVLVQTRMNVAALQNIPLCAMFLWLTFATPRGTGDLFTFAVVCQLSSITLALLMWERSAIRTERNLIIRLLHPAVLRITAARYLELTANLFLFALFTAQWGTTSVAVLLTLDVLAVVSIVVATWKLQGYTLAGSRHLLGGVLRRALLCAPVLLATHWDHFPGRVGEQNSIADPRLYVGWRVVRHALLTIATLVGIAEMTDLVAGGWYALGFVACTVCAGLAPIMLNKAMWKWQEMLELPPVGLKIPVPKQCQRESEEGEEDEDGHRALRGAAAEEARRRKSRNQLMSLYGSKASEMDGESKNARALQAEYDATGGRPKTAADVDGAGRAATAEAAIEEPNLLFKGIDMDAVINLAAQLMHETKPRCKGCEGLSREHDDLVCKIPKKVRRKEARQAKWRMPEASPRTRSERVRSHVTFDPPSPSLYAMQHGGARPPEPSSSSPHRLVANKKRRQSVHDSPGGNSSASPTSKYIVQLRQRVPLSEQARLSNRAGSLPVRPTGEVTASTGHDDLYGDESEREAGEGLDASFD